MKLVIVAFVIGCIGVVYGANPLSCYQCDNLFGTSCFDPMNYTRIPLVNCSTVLYASSKMVDLSVPLSRSETDGLEMENYVRASSSSQFECYVSVRVDNNNNTSINRGCKLIESFDYCDYVSSYYNVTKCYTCESDGCNAGYRTLGSLALMVATLFTACAAYTL